MKKKTKPHYEVVLEEDEPRYEPELDEDERDRKISKLKYEISKRDGVIQNLREANFRLTRSLQRLIRVIGWADEESLTQLEDLE